MKYLDTSALAKLIVDEAESAALVDYLSRDRGAGLVTSALTHTELRRVGQALGPDRMAAADAVLEAVTTVLPDLALFRRAGALVPRGLRSLDAIHLATALELGDALDVLVAYDRRLCDAASSNGLQVASPA